MPPSVTSGRGLLLSGSCVAIFGIVCYIDRPNAARSSALFENSSGPLLSTAKELAPPLGFARWVMGRLTLSFRHDHRLE